MSPDTADVDAAPPTEAEVIRQALRLLRESPPRSAVASDRFWAWRRRVEAFLEALDRPSAGAGAQESGRASWFTGDSCVTEVEGE